MFIGSHVVLLVCSSLAVGLRGIHSACSVQWVKHWYSSPVVDAGPGPEIHMDNNSPKVAISGLEQATAVTGGLLPVYWPGVSKSWWGEYWLVAPPSDTFNDIHEPCTRSWWGVKGQRMPKSHQINGFRLQRLGYPCDERVQTPSMRVCPQWQMSQLSD